LAAAAKMNIARHHRFRLLLASLASLGIVSASLAPGAAAGFALRRGGGRRQRPFPGRPADLRAEKDGPSPSSSSDKGIGEYDPSEDIRPEREVNVGDPQLRVKEKDWSVTSILKELSAIQQQGPQKYCILGTRHCSYLHQQIIELLYVILATFARLCCRSCCLIHPDDPIPDRISVPLPLPTFFFLRDSRFATELTLWC